MKEKYFGPNKVIGVVEEKVTTTKGNKVVRLLLENRPAEVVPLKAFELLSTTNPIDYNKLQEKRFKAVIPLILEEIGEFDVRMYELGTLMAQVHTSITNHFERASNFLWTGDDKNWTVGMSFENQRTIVDIRKVLLELEEKQKDGKSGKDK